MQGVLRLSADRSILWVKSKEIVMNKKALIGLICLIMGEPLHAWYKLQQSISRSFMYTRPAYEYLCINQAGWHSLIYNKIGSVGGAARATWFFQQSLPLSRTAHYFMPFCNTTQLIAGTDSPYANNRNIIAAEWLGMDSTSAGTISINPLQKQVGMFVEYNQNLKTIVNSDFVNNYWVSVSVPFSKVTNNLHATQHTINESSTFPHTIKQAFNNPEWQYGLIPFCSRSRTLPGEVRLKLGSWLVSKDYYQCAYQSIFVIPTGNKPQPEYLFDAVVGNNLHAGVGGAVFFQIPLNYDVSSVAACFFLNLEGIFLIRNHQYRTFDLRGKPWSRYMLYNEKGPGGRTNIPGVNILTRWAMVKPFGVFDFSTGWRFMSDWLEVEIGYNVWGKDQEEVYYRAPLNDPCTTCYGIFGIAGSGPGKTAHCSTISFKAPDDLVFKPVREVDIDFHSGAAGSILNHKAHICVNVIQEYCNTLLFGNIGTYIDIAQKNGGLKSWGLWGTIGATF